MARNRKPSKDPHVKPGSCWSHVLGNGTSVLKAQRLVKPGHVVLVPAASKLSVIGGQGPADSSESSTTTHKCSFGNASGIPWATPHG